MSLILKGIDLPTDRKPYAIEVTYRFEGADGLFSEEIFLSPNQAIQIPKDHGDIKDVSEFIKAVDHAHDNVWNRDDWLDENMRELLRDTKKRIEKLPTILEAED